MTPPRRLRKFSARAARPADLRRRTLPESPHARAALPPLLAPGRCPRVSRGRAGRSRRRDNYHLGKEDDYRLALRVACEAMPGRELMKLLGHPLCAGPAQDVLLGVLGKRCKSRFHTPWDFLDWADANGGVPPDPPAGKRR